MTICQTGEPHGEHSRTRLAGTSAVRPGGRASRFARLADLVVRRAAVEARQKLPSFRRHDGDFVVRAGERAHVVERVEPHDGDELDLAVDGPAEELDSPVPWDSPRADPLEDLSPEERLVRLCFPGPGVPFPH